MTDVETIYSFLANSPPATTQADIILVLGSHDKRVPVFASSLFNAGAAPLVICSGGLGRITQNIWTEPEADIFSKICVEHGIPIENILLERNSTNTGENFLFTRKMLDSRGLSPKTGLIVCKPYMNIRALATGQKQWPEVEWSIGTPRLSFEEYFPGGPSDQEVTIMVGDLFRLQTYAALGYQVPIEIPDAVIQAGKRLVEIGFGQQIVDMINDEK